ncbi:MAG: hypothetical protein IT384_26345 [Deltaproteobacteria bacterium]|nr:hypothetical protein [Deltaproteobacteria bacterium]
MVIDAPHDVDPAKFAREKRWLYAKAAGFLIPLFYEVGVQVVVLTGGTVKSNPQSAVDRLSNQWCMIQAIHVVELATGRLFSAATWGRSASALAQDAVSGALQHAISGRSVDPNGDVPASGRVDRAGAPGWVVAVIAAAIVAVLLQILLRFVQAIGQPPS